LARLSVIGGCGLYLLGTPGQFTSPALVTAVDDFLG
jgi:hypothetical protein